MKKLLPLAVSSALVLPLAAHAEGPIDGKVYGKINAAITSVDDKTNTTTGKDTSLTSNKSRLGFKGETDLDGGISVIYQLEYEIDPTEGQAHSSGDDTRIFKQRNAIVGLKTAVGTIMAGTHDTPTKKAQGKVDLFNDLKNGDITNVVRGEERVNDIIIYKSPEFNGFTLAAATIQEEDATSTDDGTSVSVTYKGIKNLYLAAATDSEVDGYDVQRFVAQYKYNDLTVGALVNSSEKANTPDSKDEDGSVISASYKIDKWVLKAQYGSSDEKSKGLEQTAFGVDYRLGKKSKLFFYSSTLKDDVVNGTDISTNGLGIEHKF